MPYTKCKAILLAAVLAAAAALIGCEDKDDFEGAPTASAPPRSEARPVSPDKAGAKRRAPENLPANHPPVGAMGGQGADKAGAKMPPARAQKGQAKPSSPEQFGKVGPLRWEAPSDWKAVQPSSQMRLAEYHISGADGAGVATMTVFYFGPQGGGSIGANIDRWVGQFEQPEGETAERATRTVSGMKVHLVDVAGNYDAGAAMGGGQPRSDQRMLAAIVEAPAGNFFFKMVGPQLTVAAAHDGFETLVSSFEPAK